ncbi:hypothetical protein PG993_000175 [Apiospora rasikravindrae]|uniref:Heterokaryon incompatibility domain-containing protein n=1 Tax=Apiospora rasikravindrae TaxID=990691 RepID=A0ABR1UAI3_9PEZI
MSRRSRPEQTFSLYSKLPKNSSIARLVTIFPEQPYVLIGNGKLGSFAAPASLSPRMICEIDEFSVNDETVPYKALSYSWQDADPKEKMTIICNSTAVKISLHLYKALDRLRSDAAPVKVWVDGLCINQKDVAERTHQVKIMREIYQRSTEVIVWLGDSKADDTLGPSDTQSPSLVERDVWGALDIVHSLAYGKLALDIPAFRSLDKAGPIMRGFGAIAERSWWERVWVVQEVVVAKRVTVFYGDISVPWELLCRAAEQLHRSQQNCHLDSMYPYLTEGQPLSDFARLVSNIDSTRREWRSRTPLVALQLLRKFRSHKATDPKDKVFALLGLVQYWGRSQPISADYSHSIESTFLGTMMMLISSTESLSVLAGSTGRACLATRRAPSWVIDWSFPEEEMEYSRLKTLVLHSAGGSIQGSVRLHGGGILESPACWIGKVEIIGEELIIQAATKMRKTVSSWESLLVYAQDPYATGEPLKDAFWRTICGDVEYLPNQGMPQDDSDGCPEFQRASLNAESGWEQWRSADKKHNRKTSLIGRHWLEVPDLTDNEKRRNAFNHALSCASGGRRFFVTDQGHIGIGPKDMMEGDNLFILCGSHVPFVLRQSPRKPRACQSPIPETLFRKTRRRQYIPAGRDANEEMLQTLKGEARICNRVHWPCYTVVGDAYVHGVMHEDQNIERTQTTVYIV